MSLEGGFTATPELGRCVQRLACKKLWSVLEIIKQTLIFLKKSLTKFFVPSLEPSWCEVDGYLDRVRECTLEVQSVPIVTNSVTLDFYSAVALILSTLNRYCHLDLTCFTVLIVMYIL